MGDQFSINEFVDSARHFHKTRNMDEYGRYRSWEHCNAIFNEKHDDLMKKGRMVLI